MQGAVGFMVGSIGLCFFAAVAPLVPFFMGRIEGLAVLVLILVAAFVFLNVMVVGFYRMLNNLHETVLYPDDPHYYPPRGRALFFAGYVGLLITLVAVVMLTLLQEWSRFRIRGRDADYLLFAAWFAGWAFLGCLFGGVQMLLGDIYHKAFYRSTAHPNETEADDAYDIARRGSRRPVRRED
jgi:hypothetical protein